MKYLEDTKTKFIYEGKHYKDLYLFATGNVILYAMTIEELIIEIKKRNSYRRLSPKERLQISLCYHLEII